MVGLLVVAALGAAALPASEATSSTYRKAGARSIRMPFVADVNPREGLEHTTFHVVPLVGAEPGPAAAPKLAPGDAPWSVSKRAPDLVDFDAGIEGRDRLVLAGTLLTGGARERLVDRTEPLIAPVPRALAAPVCDGRKKPGETGTPGLGPLAPIEQRKMLLLREKPDAFGLLVHIQVLLTDADAATKTLSGVLATAAFTKRVDERFAAVRRVIPSYAGRTRGHVVFFGYRPMEVVVARTPALYRAVAPAYLRAASFSHAAWVEATGLTNRQGGLVEPQAYFDTARDILGNLGQMKLRAFQRDKRGTFTWPQYVGTVDGGRASEAFVARVSCDEEGNPQLLEAIENGRDLIHPVPLRSPGGAAVDDMPDISGGSLTDAYLERLLRRRSER